MDIEIYIYASVAINSTTTNYELVGSHELVGHHKFTFPKKSMSLLTATAKHRLDEEPAASNKKYKSKERTCVVEGCTAAATVAIHKRQYARCREHAKMPKCCEMGCPEFKNLQELKMPGIKMDAKQYVCKDHLVPPPPVAIDPVELSSLISWGHRHFGRV